MISDMRMIERIARIICRSAQIDPNKTAFSSSSAEPGKRLAWMDFADQAREILLVIREPTREMLRAGPRDFGADGWHAMIDAALKDERWP